MIYKKLLDFQKLGISIKKDGSNPHFKSSYATLNEVLDKVKKPLNDLGILILQMPEKDGLRTKLIDTEDKSDVECFMPYVEIVSAQKLGSNNTYNRRYSLITLLGLEDTDDDGEVGSKQMLTQFDVELYKTKLNTVTNLDELKTVWSSMPAEAKKMLEALKTELKNKYENINI